MPSARRRTFASSTLFCVACGCLLQLGCASLRSADVAALPGLGKAKGPLPKEEAQAAIQQIDAARDQAQCAQALSLWKQGKSAESRHLLEQILKRTPNQPEARRLLADLALEAGQVQEAERLLLALVNDHPDDEAARAALAWLYESQGRPEDAQQQFRRIDETFSPADYVPG